MGYKDDRERLKLAGKRPLAGHDLSDFGLLGHLKRVVYLNPEVTHLYFQVLLQKTASRSSNIDIYMPDRD